MHDYACMQCRRTPHGRRKKRITMASVAKAPLQTTLLFAALALSAAELNPESCEGRRGLCCFLA